MKGPIVDPDNDVATVSVIGGPVFHDLLFRRREHLSQRD